MSQSTQIAYLRRRVTIVENVNFVCYLNINIKKYVIYFSMIYLHTIKTEIFDEIRIFTNTAIDLK